MNGCFVHLIENLTIDFLSFFPSLGFSRQIVSLLDGMSVEYGSFNILADQEVRQGREMEISSAIVVYCLHGSFSSC